MSTRASLIYKKDWLHVYHECVDDWVWVEIWKVKFRLVPYRWLR